MSPWIQCGGGRPLLCPQSCEGPQRKAWGLGWPPGSWPNPLLMSGQPEGLSPWPQPYNPESPSQAELGAGRPLKPLQAPFSPLRSAHPPHSHPSAGTPALVRPIHGPSICKGIPGRHLTCAPTDSLGYLPFVQGQVPHGAGQGRLSLMIRGLLSQSLFYPRNVLDGNP